MNIGRTILVAAASLTVALVTSGSASASTGWERHHPRRNEVIDRLQNQTHRIREERMEGELSGRQAWRLHREDRNILQQERLAARFDGGHITRAEQRVLNHEENHVSSQIGR